MISYIKGKLESIKDNYIVLESQDIGYQIFVSGKCREQLPALYSFIRIFTYMYIREDEISLYGFLSEQELDVFKILLGISGVGPKVALSVLTSLSVQDLYIAVASNDAKAITKANGVGLKGAQRIILELKDKLDITDMLGNLDEESSDHSNIESSVIQDVVSALTSLGYSSSEALLAVKKVDGASDMDSGQLLREALKRVR